MIATGPGVHVSSRRRSRAPRYRSSSRVLDGFSEKVVLSITRHSVEARVILAMPFEDTPGRRRYGSWWRCPRAGISWTVRVGPPSASVAPGRLLRNGRTSRCGSRRMESGRPACGRGRAFGNGACEPLLFQRGRSSRTYDAERRSRRPIGTTRSPFPTPHEPFVEQRHARRRSLRARRPAVPAQHRAVATQAGHPVGDASSRSISATLSTSGNVLHRLGDSSRSLGSRAT